MPTQPEPTDRAEDPKLATTAEQATPTAVDRGQAARWLAALDELAGEQPTVIRVEDPDIPSWKDGVQIGKVPPVAQSGIPPMSARTVEVTRAVMYCSLATVPPGLIAVAVMVASEHANPTVIGMICAAPAAIAVPILALKALMGSAKQVVEAAPAVHHHTYEGAVYQDQREIRSKNTGVWVKTNNEIS